MINAFIIGSSGTTGLRLRERLGERSDVQLLEIDDALRRDKGEILRLMGLSDYVFLCLPDDAAREIVALSHGMSAKIIDCSTAHRTAPGFTYGFPELSPKHRAEIADCKYLASPGCHASGFIALVYPLIAAGIINGDCPLCCTSITGYSGGGKQMISDYENPNRLSSLDSPMEYAMGQAHKHLPEIMAQCGLSTAPVFMPIVGDFHSGMLVTVPLHASMLTKSHSPSDIRRVLADHYSGGNLVRVSPDAPSALYANALAGGDDMEISVSGNDERILLTALFDNLGKGAAGAAIQCFNIMCGLPEETGLNISQ